VVPRALSTAEIARVVADYRRAARNAHRAGFDFVELHAAHGYLVEQFLCDGTNHREDEYGGTVANRCRFLFEVVAALVDELGPARVGVRLSPCAHDPATGKPYQTYFGTLFSDPEPLYDYAIERLNDFPLAYLMLTEPRVGGLSVTPEADRSNTHPLRNTRYRSRYHGLLIGAGGFAPRAAGMAVAEGHYDLVAFGRWFLANPDLPERLKHGRPLNVYDRSTFYGTGIAGYTDYPRWEGETAAAATTAVYPLMEQTAIGVALVSSQL
jgi:N-ethylmaleimide reductase